MKHNLCVNLTLKVYVPHQPHISLSLSKNINEYSYLIFLSNYVFSCVLTSFSHCIMYTCLTLWKFENLNKLGAVLWLMEAAVFLETTAKQLLMSLTQMWGKCEDIILISLAHYLTANSYERPLWDFYIFSVATSCRSNECSQIDVQLLQIRFMLMFSSFVLDI